MSKKILIMLVAIFLVVPFSVLAKKGSGNSNGTGVCQFIDENGDGINDNFRDHDGDGIPNRLDPDWTRPEDGSGYKNRYGVTDGESSDKQNRYRRGPRFGGNGFGSGICDGDGPFGSTHHNRYRKGEKGKD